MISGQDVRTLLGKRIRFYRQQRRLSQAVLAEKANISITFLSKIERGVKFPTSDSLSGIANGLEVSLGDLFQETEAPPERPGMLERFKADITKTVLTSLDAVYKAYKG